LRVLSFPTLQLLSFTPTPSPLIWQGLLSTEALASVPFLILGNKMDVAGCAQEPELRAHLGLHETTGKGVTSLPKDSGVRPIELFMCSLLKRYGYGDGFKWLNSWV